MIDKLDALNKARKNPDLNLDQLRSATLALQSAMANCADEIIAFIKASDEYDRVRVLRSVRIVKEADRARLDARKALEAKIREEVGG